MILTGNIDSGLQFDMVNGEACDFFHGISFLIKTVFDGEIRLFSSIIPNFQRVASALSREGT
jgi:hypothetical protein